jgi:hypothetical protein
MASRKFPYPEEAAKRRPQRTDFHAADRQFFQRSSSGTISPAAALIGTYLFVAVAWTAASGSTEENLVSHSWDGRNHLNSDGLQGDEALMVSVVLKPCSPSFVADRRDCRSPANPGRKALLNGANPSDGRKGTAAWQDSWVKSHRKWHFREPKVPERRAPKSRKTEDFRQFPSRAYARANVKNIGCQMKLAFGRRRTPSFISTIIASRQLPRAEAACASASVETVKTALTSRSSLPLSMRGVGP